MKESNKQIPKLTDKDLNRDSQLEKELKHFRSFPDSRFGKIEIFQKQQTQEIIFAIERRINDKQEALKELQETIRQQSITHEYLIKFIDYSIHKKSELCTTLYILVKYFEYPKTDLHKEFTERQKKSSKFTNAELTHLFYQLILVQNYYHTHDLLHGNWQPLYIGYDSKRTEFKLIHQENGEVNWIKFIQLQKKNLVTENQIFQSPLMFSQLKKGSTKFTYDPKKEEAFQLGLIILEAGTAKSVQTIYDHDNGIVDRPKLEQLIREFRNEYEEENTLICTVVASMLSYDESTRSTAELIVASVPSYDLVREFLKQEAEAQNTQKEANVNQERKVSGTPTDSLKVVQAYPQGNTQYNNDEDNDDIIGIHNMIQVNVQNQQKIDYQKQYEMLSNQNKPTNASYSEHKIYAQPYSNKIPQNEQGNPVYFSEKQGVYVERQLNHVNNQAYEAVIVPQTLYVAQTPNHSTNDDFFFNNQTKTKVQTQNTPNYVTSFVPETHNGYFDNSSPHMNSGNQHYGNNLRAELVKATNHHNTHVVYEPKNNNNGGYQQNSDNFFEIK